jgi:hypothetical protein
MKADGSIKAWGDSDFGGKKAPTGKGYFNKISISPFSNGFSANTKALC